MSAPQYLEKFIEKVMAEKGVVSVSQEANQKMKNDLLEQLQTLVDATILQHLPDSKIPEFEKLLDKSNVDPKEFEKFCHDSIPSLDEIVAAVLVNFRARYLGDLATSH